MSTGCKIHLHVFELLLSILKIIVEFATREMSHDRNELIVSKIDDVALFQVLAAVLPRESVMIFQAMLTNIQKRFKVVTESIVVRIKCVQCD